MASNQPGQTPDGQSRTGSRPEVPLQHLPPPHAMTVPPKQEFAPYPGPAPQAYPVFPSPPQAPFDRRWHIAKLALGSASIVCCVILVALSVYLNAASESHRGLFDMGWVAAVAGCALLFQALEFLFVGFAKHGRRPGIHPGLHVPVHLIIWAVAAIGLAVIAVFISNDESYDYDGDYYDDIDSYWAARRFQQIEKAIVAFLAILTLIHCILFVRACVETHRINRVPKYQIQYVAVPLPPGHPYYSPGAAMVPSPAQTQMQMPQAREAPQQASPIEITEQDRAVAREARELRKSQNAMFGYYAPENSFSAPNWPSPLPGQGQAAPRPGPSQS